METERAVDPRDTRRFFDEKALRRARFLDERFAEANADAEKIIEMVQRDYRPSRIWRWGSLLDRSRFSEISDIDIAVEGIGDTATFFALYGKALAMTAFPLDLIELERIEPIHADSIRKNGRLVYERH
jgi:predicted nucleotidyltransferase